jgi:hypothetical protein
MKDKLHIITIFTVIIVVVIIAIIAGKFLTPESYGLHGQYRWNSIKQIASLKTINQSVKVCQECHNDLYLIHEKDAHYNVPCVDCHGPANKHVSYYRSDENSKSITKDEATLKKEYNLEGCLYCHRKLKARPSDFPQIDKIEHYKFLNVIDNTTKCTECHSPHEPIFLLTEVDQSRLHPIINRCRDCHTEPVGNDYSKVKGHPKIFECKDCHAEIVSDFSSKPHHNHIECTSCHLFHKQDETSGRMYKNGNAKFCLLCHENKSFKSPTYPPKIQWPNHIGKLKYLANINQKICLNCHVDKIHKMNLNYHLPPHTVNWNVEHGSLGLDKSKTKFNPTCNQCHQNNYCNDCHKVKIPHPEDWLEIHHTTVEKKGKQVCQNCHKQSSCASCH